MAVARTGGLFDAGGQAAGAQGVGQGLQLVGGGGVLQGLGLGAWSRVWLGDPDTAIYAIIAMSQWQGFGYAALLFSVAIQKIPAELYDAARMDGAGALRQIWSITLPMTREMTGMMVIITVTGAFQVFNEVMVMTGGGPNNASQVLGTWLYEQGFNQNDMGLADSSDSSRSRQW